MIPSPGWDLDGAAESGGLFGLPHLPEEARVRVLGVPYEATVSYGAGTAEALDAVMHASKQVELHAGPWREGVALLPGADLVRAWNDEAARKQLLKLFEALGPTHELTQSGRRRLSSVLFS